MENDETAIPMMDPEYEALMNRMNEAKSAILSILKGYSVSEAKNILRTLIDWELENNSIIK